MAHLERRSTPKREGQIALVTGAVYGVAHTLSGHPLDNLKARLQLDKSLHGSSTLAAARHLWRTEGARAYYRGCVPPLWGSAVYRAVMMSSYETMFTYLDAHEGSLSKVELFGCIRPVVVTSAVFCALCRGIVEAPIEQAKVMGQTNKTWEVRSLYRGLGPQIARTTAMLLAIFVPYDYARRKTSVLSTLSGQFLLVGSVCAASYAVIHPLETLKNLAQAGLPRPGATLASRLQYVGGPRGLYRGALPSILCGGLRNGAATVAMNGFANPLITRLGLREM
jgi:solute carrier family 25 (mitochondrial carnitine/acylcarnitine transporter), member 20/29